MREATHQNGFPVRPSPGRRFLNQKPNALSGVFQVRRQEHLTWNGFVEVPLLSLVKTPPLVMPTCTEYLTPPPPPGRLRSR